VRLGVAFPDLDRLLAALGLRPVPFRIERSRLAAPNAVPDDVEVDDIGDVQVTPEGVFVGPNGPVFLHINRMRTAHQTVEAAVADVGALRRFHFLDCEILRAFRARGALEKFILVARTDGPFRVHLETPGGRTREAFASLLVCQKCLAALDWEGFRAADLPRRKAIVANFSRAAFVQRHTTSFASLPSRREAFAGAVDYPADWPEIARRVKADRGLRCEPGHGGCGVRCEGAPHLLDVHHLNEVRSDCRPENLAVLCKLCHARVHPHYALAIRLKDRDALERLRAAQGVR
jgi:hypothetical protein